MTWASLEQWQKNHAIYQNNKWISLSSKELEPLEPVQKQIYQSNTYRKELSWLHFNDKLMVQEQAASEGSAVLDIRFCSIPNKSK